MAYKENTDYQLVEELHLYFDSFEEFIENMPSHSDLEPNTFCPLCVDIDFIGAIKKIRYKYREFIVHCHCHHHPDIGYRYRVTIKL